MALVEAHRETLTRVAIRIPRHDPLRDCWACGERTELERAHILARTAKGTVAADNLLLLCNECHHDQPDGASKEGQILWLLEHETHDRRLSRISQEIVESVMSQSHAAQWAKERLLNEAKLKDVVNSVRARLGRATLAGIRSSLRYELRVDYNHWHRTAKLEAEKAPSTEAVVAAAAAARRETESLFASYPLLSKSISTSLKKIRREGKKTGGDVPYGYQLGSDGKTLQPLASEQAVVAAARELFKRGTISMREIGRVLARRQMLSRTGRIFHSKQVTRMLRDTHKCQT